MTLGSEEYSSERAPLSLKASLACLISEKALLAFDRAVEMVRHVKRCRSFTAEVHILNLLLTMMNQEVL